MAADHLPEFNDHDLAHLLRRIGRYLSEQAGNRDWIYQEGHPATLLVEAEAMLHDLGQRTGLIRLPKPIPRRPSKG